MSDNAAGTASYDRVFDAPRELVFRCLVEPEHLRQFWGPTGTYAPADGIVVDPRPGGVFETVMVSEQDGSRYVMRAVYDEIVEPERLAWTEVESGMRCVSTLTDLGDGRTRLTIEQTNVPPPMLAREARAGFQTSLDRFASYLRALRPAGRA